MRRRIRVSLVWPLCALGLVPLSASAQTYTVAPRPNFVFLLADDQRADALGCAGHPHLKTPNIDRLARAGVRFSNAFAVTAICCTARADLLTGRHAKEHGVVSFGRRLTPEALAITYPLLLKQAGYKTAMLGKWGIGEPATGSFNYWHAWEGQGGYFHQDGKERVHNSRYLASHAEKFLRSLEESQNFCLTVCYKSPHEPFQPDPELGDLFPGAQFAKAKSYSDEDFSRQPPFIQKSEGRARLKQRHPTDAKYQEFCSNYYGCIASIDASIGHIVEVLDELDLLNNTVIVYTSDHGFFLGEHGMSGKWLMYEESIRVPLIIRHPRLPKQMVGKTIDAMTLNLDLAPTILELAGVAVPPEMDGRSLKPLMGGELPADWRKMFFYEHHYGHNGTIPRCEGVRTADWKYIAYYSPTSYNVQQPMYEQIFYLAADPHEEYDLAHDAQYEVQLNQLRELYRQQAKLHSSAN